MIKLENGLLIDKTKGNIAKEMDVRVKFWPANAPITHPDGNVYRGNSEGIMIKYDIYPIGLLSFDTIYAKKKGISEEGVEELYRRLKNSELKFCVYPFCIQLDEDTLKVLSKMGFDGSKRVVIGKYNFVKMMIERRKSSEKFELEYAEYLKKENEQRKGKISELCRILTEISNSKQ